MAMSGVQTDDEVLSTYQDQLRIKKEGKEHLGCMILKISDDSKRIILDKTFPAGKLTWEGLKSQLPTDEGRYVVYDFKYQTKNGAEHNKIVFIAWNPDGGKIKLKMLYSASKDAIKKKLEAVAHEVQANDLGDLDESEIEDKLRKN